MRINAPEGAGHGTHTNGTACIRGTYSRVHTQTHTNTHKYKHTTRTETRIYVYIYTTIPLSYETCTLAISYSIGPLPLYGACLRVDRVCCPCVSMHHGIKPSVRIA